MTESAHDMSKFASERLESIANILKSPSNLPFGTVSRIVGMTIEAQGLMASLGTICVIQSRSGLVI